MKEDKATHLRASLERLTVDQLSAMLQEELRQEVPDGNAVRLILSILEAREEDRPIETNPEIDEAWETYLEHTRRPAPSPGRSWRWLRVASVAAVLLLVISVLPQTVTAESLWQRLARWTDSIFEFFNSGTPDDPQPEYVFKTDNPGLQEVYDAITELGVTDPVVPMWLPEGYELEEYKLVEMPTMIELHARFIDRNYSMVLTVNIYNEEQSFEYIKDGTDIVYYECSGTSHHIMRNNDRWVVAWTKSHMECAFTIDCQEDILYKILESIYKVEEN